MPNSQWTGSGQGSGEICISARLSGDDAGFTYCGLGRGLRASEKPKASLVPNMVPLACCAAQWPTIPPTLDTGQSPQTWVQRQASFQVRTPSCVHYSPKESPASESHGLKKQEAAWAPRKVTSPLLPPHLRAEAGGGEGGLASGREA